MKTLRAGVAAATALTLVIALNLAHAPAAIAAGSPHLMCEFILMPLPNGGVIQVPIRCCDLDSLLPICSGPDGTAELLAVPENLPHPPSVPSRIIDQIPMGDPSPESYTPRPSWPR